ncbi:hypothetical protein V6N13_021206 [Hibiscus sabdariffa]|uniref:Uncharacterized protein n=1 Tax=Hibiscus sabdariffa TaxID=183260 RepID=A0ABR2EVR8_9ROSI
MQKRNNKRDTTKLFAKYERYLCCCACYQSKFLWQSDFEDGMPNITPRKVGAWVLGKQTILAIRDECSKLFSVIFSIPYAKGNASLQRLVPAAYSRSKQDLEERRGDEDEVARVDNLGGGEIFIDGRKGMLKVWGRHCNRTSADETFVPTPSAINTKSLSELVCFQ